MTPDQSPLPIDRLGGDAIGQIGLLPEVVNGKCHTGIGWILNRRHWHRGYAVEGARAVLDYAFNRRGPDRIIADIRPENTASVRMAEHLALIPCGEYDKPVGGAPADRHDSGRRKDSASDCIFVIYDK